ncbi:hypothetical protein G7046_g1053 [Stylonectria norvegica]|nr:hypothetical protein G7046_g1053 [Stylonectria norvegica]
MSSTSSPKSCSETPFDYISSSQSRESTMPPGSIESVAVALEDMFYGNLLRQNNATRSTPLQAHIDPCHQALKTKINFKSDNIRFQGILPLLVQDLVCFASVEVSSLGCPHVETGGAQFFSAGLANDTAQTMFDSLPINSNPLREFGRRQQTQLIDVWYSVHPLSFVVSKTMILRELRDGTHDEILLAAMLADANFSIGDGTAVARGHALMQWAIAQLRTRPLPSNQHLSTSTGSTRVSHDIGTAQALMLIAWHALCSSQIRRAICYITLVRNTTLEIKDRLSSTVVPMPSSRINGIDVSEIDKEIVEFLYWTSYSLNIWVSAQMETGETPASLFKYSPSIDLPITEASSALIQLDRVSWNFSTLRKQKSVIREMWPLAHVANAVAQIFALKAEQSDMVDWPGTRSFSGESLLAIRPDGALPSTMEICRKLDTWLVDNIYIIEKQVTEVIPRSFVLIIYHTMAIRCLFPIFPSKYTEETLSLNAISWFCSMADKILETFASAMNQPEHIVGNNTSIHSLLVTVFCMSLHTCARAFSVSHSSIRLKHLSTDTSITPEPMKTSGISELEAQLEALAYRLYAVSQYDVLNQEASIRWIRKHLKANSRPSDHSLVPSISRFGCADTQPTTESPLTFASSLEDFKFHQPNIANTVCFGSQSTFAYTMETPGMVTTKSPTPSASSQASLDYAPGPFLETNRPTMCSDAIPVSEITKTSSRDQMVSEIAAWDDIWCSQMPALDDFEMAGSISMLGEQWIGEG